MAPERPDRLLGISIDDPGDRRSEDGDQGDEETYERFLFVRLGDHRLAFPIDEIRTIADPPAEENVTRVPRSPAAVEGLVDLRGEITAIIEPRIHFPVDAEPPESPPHVIFDRPTDRQAAAIRVDDILGVQTVPESNVLEPDEVEDPAVAGGALEHPLVVGILEEERQERPERGRRSDVTANRRDRSGRRRGEVTSAPIAERMDRHHDDDVISDEFVLEEEGTAVEETTARPSKTVVEATGIVDVEALLFASGIDPEQSE